MQLVRLPYNKIVFLVIVTSLLLVISCNSKSANVEANPDSSQSGQSGVLNGISVKAWKGNGFGGEDRSKTKEKGVPVFFAKGGDNQDSQTVIASLNPSQILQDGHYYELTTNVLAEGITKHFDFIVAVRSGKTNDIFNIYDHADSWQKLTLLIKPTATASPKYIAVRLYGPGKIWTTPFKFREIDKKEFEQLAKDLKAEKSIAATKRLERVLVKASPSLPLAGKDSPQLFRTWAIEEDQLPPPTQGWKLVPGELAELSTELLDKLQRNEYLVYTRNEATPIYLESVPRANELAGKLMASATPGEYEPLNFAIYPGKNLEGLKLRVSDLVTDKGSRIASANIDVRTVNFVRKIKDKGKKTYFLMPMTLSKGPDFIDMKTSRRYWITVLVPKTAKAGIYKGIVEIIPGNAQIQKIPVEFTVLPFDLLDPPIVRFMWSSKVTVPANDEKMNLDLREHGMTTMMLGGEVKTRDRKVDQQDIDHMVNSINNGMELHKKLGFRDQPIGGISNNQIVIYWDKSINWFRFWPITKELDDEFISTYRRVFLENNHKSKWPEMYHYIVDEPGGANPKNLEPTQHYLSLFKKNFPELKTFVTIGGGMKQGYDEIGMLSPYLDVTATNYVTKDVINRLGKLGSSFWVYNGSSLNAEPIKERFFYGWYSWKVGARGVGQWTYAWTGRPYAKIFRDNRHDYAMQTNDGFIPTVGWELIREGIDDYKYINTISKLIGLGLKSENKDFRKQAQNSQIVLNNLRARVNINYQRGSDVPESKVVGISPDDLTSFRAQVINSMVQLIASSKTPWPVLRDRLAHIEEIALQVPTEQDWNSSVPSRLANGKDLLSDTRFGGVLSDWKAQVWKGKGGGTFESNMLFEKNKTAKLYIESDSKGDNAVLVLQKPTLTLKRGVKYRLSTWVKTDSVTQYVTLLAAVRGGGIADLMSTKIHGTNDWSELWVDFTPEDDTVAQYLALRLWGKGTVYVDKIKFQAI